MKYSILLLMTCAFAAGQTELSLQLESAHAVSFHAEDGQKTTLHPAKLLYVERDGTQVPASETYLVSVSESGYARIVDVLEGHSVRLQMADMDGKVGNELLVFYFSGGNQYGVRVYSVEGGTIQPLKTQPRSSNMRSARLSKGKIVIENEEQDDDGIRFISKETYVVADDGCKLISEDKRFP